MAYGDAVTLVAYMSRVNRVETEEYSFQWVASGRSHFCEGPAIHIGRVTLRLSAKAARLLITDGDEPGFVEVGLARRAIAIRRAPQGWRLHPNAGGYTFHGTRLVKDLVAAGWETGQSYPAIWDAEHRMLVVKMPPPPDARGRGRKIAP